MLAMNCGGVLPIVPVPFWPNTENPGRYTRWCRPFLAVECQIIAIEEGIDRLVAFFEERRHSAPDADRALTGPDRHAALLFGKPATDETRNTLGEARHQLSRIPVLVVDEFVDHQIGIGSNGEGRSIDKQHLNKADAIGADLLVEEYGLTELDRAHLPGPLDSAD